MKKAIALFLALCLCVGLTACCKHVKVVDPAVAATCTETGLTEGSHCTECDKVFVQQEVVPATGHVEVVDNAVSATCTESGLTEGTSCSTCGEVFVAQETIPATGHTEVVVEGKAATCTESGLTESKYCSVCNEVLVAQETIPAGHTETTIDAKEATCTESGLTGKKICSVCDEVLAEQETIPALGHTTNDGICSRCGTDTRLQSAIKLMDQGKYIEASKILAKCSESAEARQLQRECGTEAIRKLFKEKGKNDGAGTYYLYFSSETFDEITAAYNASKDQVILKGYYEGVVEGFMGLVYTPTTAAVTYGREAYVDQGSLWGYIYQGGILLSTLYSGTYTESYGTLDIPGMLVFEEESQGALSHTTEFYKATVDQTNELFDALLDALVNYGFGGTMRDLGLIAYNP